MGHRSWRHWSIAAAVLAGVFVPVAAADAEHGEVPRPALSAPPDGIHGHALFDSYYDLEPFGYEEQEHLVSGTATSATGTTAPFTTRIIVTRPSDPTDFNGTVLLDWVNVTAQFEIAVDTLEAREMLMREGFAYVHVSTQAAGLCCTPLTPEVWDPVRYAELSHPGDDYAFDIFAQVAQAFRSPATEGADPMGDLGVGSVEHVLAAGQSQSALRLRRYIDEWLPAHPEAVGLIDGFLIHGDVGASKPFADPLPVKVLNLLSDLEAVDDGFDPATADPSYRLWEVAGTGHSDYFIGHQAVFGHGPRTALDAPKQTPEQYEALITAAGNYGERLEPELATCIVAGSTMPMHYAASAAIHQLDEWVRGGDGPDHGPRFEFADGERALDEHGNTMGGIRLPPIDVPVARYESTLCQLGGITIPFNELQLVQLYGTHAEYYAQMAARTDAAVASGWLLPEDAIDLMERACAASIRFPTSPPGCAAYIPPAFDQPLPAGADTPSAAKSGLGGLLPWDV